MVKGPKNREEIGIPLALEEAFFQHLADQLDRGFLKDDPKSPPPKKSKSKATVISTGFSTFDVTPLMPLEEFAAKYHAEPNRSDQTVSTYLETLNPSNAKEEKIHQALKDSYGDVLIHDTAALVKFIHTAAVEGTLNRN
jgi:hypothetical protein